MIEHGLFHQPPVVARDRAKLDCGCTVAVGVRTDLDPPEAATSARACSPEHRLLIERFNLALGDSLVNPQQDRLLIEVVDELLVAVGGDAEVGTT